MIRKVPAMSSTLALPNARLGVRLPGFKRRGVPSVAQTFTLDGLRARRDWTVLDSSPLSFVDHLIVTPSGVLAVTARYHEVLDGEDAVKRSWQAIRAARAAGTVLQEMLGHGAPTVTPVLMMWGPGAPDLEDGYLVVKGVHAVDFRRPEAWADRYARPAMDEMTRRRVVKVLRGLRNSDRAGTRAVAAFVD
jgi:hypothetical protein